MKESLLIRQQQIRGLFQAYAVLFGHVVVADVVCSVTHSVVIMYVLDDLDADPLACYVPLIMRICGRPNT